ncbi:hypothetical protein [Chryseobacterium populi]|uniref:Redox-active disulfide protein 2 n=1 Tax=Chryseobacterium populi TaxID=1144316 RepID=J3CGW1_9FLAO|nr:hypothetical protein [Chryseobacterium populi]EJL71424.1 hypothetical protein PMI13_02372 [Chryseobacterium populi]
MNKNKLSAMTNAELLKQQKILKTITAMLAGAILVLFAASLILAFKKQLIALNAIPVALLPVLILNLKSLKEFKEEIKSRGL